MWRAEDETYDHVVDVDGALLFVRRSASTCALLRFLNDPDNVAAWAGRDRSSLLHECVVYAADYVALTWVQISATSSDRPSLHSVSGVCASNNSAFYAYISAVLLCAHAGGWNEKIWLFTVSSFATLVYGV